MAKLVGFFLILTTVFFSCATTGFNFSATASEKNFSQLEDLQLEILDLRFEKNPRNISEKRKQISQKISQLKVQDVVSSNYFALLFGLEGEVAQIIGDKAGVRNAVAAIEKSGGATEYLTILKSYLEKSSLKRLEILEAVAATPLIRLHLAQTYLDVGKYAAAVSEFDRALIALPDIYSQYYGETRQLAFHMMENSHGGKEVFTMKRLNYKQVFSGLLAETRIFQELLGMEKISEDRVAREVDKMKILHENINLQAECPRSHLAVILMELFATENEKAALVRRLENYKSRNRSPIGDLPFDHPHFVAVIFAVEGKFIALRDGENFFPQDAIGGFEFNDTLNRLRNVKITAELIQSLKK